MQLDARLEVELTSFALVKLGSLLGLVPKKSGSHEGTSTDIGARQGGNIWVNKGKKPTGCLSVPWLWKRCDGSMIGHNTCKP